MSVSRIFQSFAAIATPRGARLADLRRRVASYVALACQRRNPARLSDAQLDDIGVSRFDMTRDVARPFWDVPSNWRV